MEFVATAAFGLEGLVRDELTALGFAAKAEQGGARFEADALGAFKANLHLACADRVLWVIGEREVRSFEELFQFVLSLPFDSILPREAAFPVSGNCVRSQLMSVSDCQKITKKAIVERMKRRHKAEWFPETGPVYQVQVHIHRDKARVSIDTSGQALNKRGYRTLVGEAPLRETLAAALLRLSPWQAGRPLYDPFCGSGTLLIEAAYLAARRAPGLTRSFAMESWAKMPKAEMNAFREVARAAYEPDRIAQIAGSDVDAEALSLCKRHLVQAGIGGKIQVQQADIKDLSLSSTAPFILSNPPYGERIGDQRQAEALLRALGRLAKQHPGAGLGLITASPAAERIIGKRASSKRRLYNGRLECEFLVFDAL